MGGDEGDICEYGKATNSEDVSKQKDLFATQTSNPSSKNSAKPTSTFHQFCIPDPQSNLFSLILIQEFTQSRWIIQSQSNGLFIDFRGGDGVVEGGGGGRCGGLIGGGSTVEEINAYEVVEECYRTILCQKRIGQSEESINPRCIPAK